MAVSPDGRSLYLASRIDNVGAAAPARPCDGHALGSISILDIARAAGGGPDAVLARVPAGCGPVRVTLSAGGETAWVTAQEGNQLLAFRTAALVGDPGRSLLASTPVDRAPTGIALIEADGVVAVTNSNRFRAPQAPQSITLLDARKVLSGQPGLLATIPVGAFPRELTLQGDGRTLLLTNYNSGTVDLFDVRRLPKPTG
jgi:DNA-binding beta-propeller fold protein YncE